MSARREMPWHNVLADIIAGIDATNAQRRFVNVRTLTMHILQNPAQYPHITANVRQLTRERTIQARITTCLKKYQWPQFSAHSTSAGGGVFVDERY